MASIQIGPLIDAGNFSYAQGDGLTLAVRYLYAQDLNGDGKDEVIFAGFETQYNTPENYSNTQVSIFGWQNDQLTNLTGQYLPNGINQVQGVGDIAFGDFNGDGLVDVYLSGNADMEYTVHAYELINLGGSFTRIDLGPTKWEHGVASGDINQDGYDDVIVAGYVHPSPFLLGSADGLVKHLVSDSTTYNSYTTFGSGVAVADFLGDGSQTFIVADSAIGDVPNDTKLARLVIDQTGNIVGFKDIATLPTPRLDLPGLNPGNQTAPISHDVRARAFDFTNDGLMDALVFSRATWDGSEWPEVSQLQLLKNKGGGVFEDVTDTILHGYDLYSNVSYTPIIEDINGDGLTDIFLSEGSWGGEYRSTTLLLAQQDGTFVDSFRKELCALVDTNGGIATLLKQAENQFYLVTETQSYGGAAEVKTASLYFTDRDQSEALHGARTNDVIYGMGGDDAIRGMQGNDSINGGSGRDMAVYEGNFADYRVNQTAEGLYVVTDNSLNRDGVDTLSEVERLQFADANVALDVGHGQNAGMAYRIYKAAFDRTPDREGLSFWINALDQGFSLEQVATTVMTSPEFGQVYGANSSNRTFVDLLYQHVLHRAADDEGFNFWNSALNAGYSRGAVLAVYTECPETIALTSELVASGIQYQAW